MKQLQFFQAYTQAPWRVQVKIASIFLLGLVIIALIAGFYLSVSAQIAAAGIEIQLMDGKRVVLNQQIADAQIQLAVLYSANEMAKRARILGFNYTSSENAVYVVAPGFQPPSSDTLSVSQEKKPTGNTTIQERYHLSLWDWILANIIHADNLLEGE